MLLSLPKPKIIERYVRVVHGRCGEAVHAALDPEPDRPKAFTKSPKLTKQQVAKLRRAITNGWFRTDEEMAQKHGVTYAQVCYVKKRFFSRSAGG